LQPDTAVSDISEGRSMLAVQGPLAARVLEQLLDAKVAGLGRFEIAPIRTMGPEACIARTGYTGGDGFELFLDDRNAQRLWDLILLEAKSAGILPIGLGARDTLRVEAGLRLYGTDMATATTPFEAGLEWTVAIHKEAFIGKDVLMKQKQDGVAKRLVGFELASGPVPRAGAELAIDPAGGGAGGRRVGTVTSGTFSPMLQRPLGMAYVEAAYTKPGTSLTLTVRGQRYTATVVKMPFWKPDRPSPVAGLAAGPTLERFT
jgi:aminomethyltransferase